MSIRAAVLVVSFAVNLYLLGVMVMFGAIVYPGFTAVERAGFPAVYDAFNSRIGAPVVVWEFLAFLIPLALYLRRPEAIPAAAVHAVTLLGIAYFAITFGWHLPAHRPLAAGTVDAGGMQTLLRSQWARTVVQAVKATLMAGMTAAAIG